MTADSRRGTDRTYKVFISSTYLDNADRRKTVEDAVLAAEMLPIGMERFTASSRPTVEQCLEWVRGADLLVGVVAWRYGWVPDGRETSISELEYDAARDAGVDRLMFEVASDAPIVNPAQDLELDPTKLAKLAAFKARYAKDQMPGLFRDQSLGLRVHKALEDWRESREPLVESAPRPPDEPESDTTPDLHANDVTRYLRKVASIHERIPVAGFHKGVQVPIRLDDLFVPLEGVVNLSALSGAPLGSADQAEKHFAGRVDQARIPLSEAFWRAKAYGARRGVVILGDPGSGKTTHLKRLLLWLAREDPTALGLPADMRPVFLPLRKLENPGTTLHDFALAELSEAQLEVDPEFGAKLLKTDRLLFLLDGLDEVADPEARATVARWIEDGLSRYPGSRFVVTCRYPGYERDARLSGEFLELHLRPLSREQASAFITNWFRTVESCVTDDEDLAESRAQEKAAELEQRLAEPDFRASRVFELTRNPLLLTSICLVHMDGGRLPSRRVDLYLACSNVLLERWRAAKKLPVSVSASQARQVLQPAAFWLHEQDERTRASVEELAPVVEPALREMKFPDVSGARFLETIRDESGLLVGWSGEEYGFLHLGFQEYLAAREIARRSRAEPEILEELARHFGESWWREVILLLLALEDAPFEEFMRHVVEQPAFVTDGQLVSDCIEDALRTSTAPFEAILERGAGDDEELWERQVAAVRVLERISPDDARGEVLETLARQLRRGSGGIVFSADVSERLLAGPAEIELVVVPGGSFEMGSSKTDPESYDDERPAHTVVVPAFQMARAPVTNEQYGRYLKANPQASEPDYWGDRRYNAPDQPVVGVSWDDVQAFCAWAGLRLPSEAEWEYACRAGTTTLYWSGDNQKNLADVGWYRNNSDGRLHAVGEKPANPFGLCDMHGGVWEWCEDTWHDSYEGAPDDGSAWVEGASDDRVVRGGCFDDFARGARSACRDHGLPCDGDRHLGFRPASSVIS